jgi:hypothetical protein
MNITKLYNKRTKTHRKNINYDNGPCVMTVEIRFDDKCKNKHNTFAITGTIVAHPQHKYYSPRDPVLTCGCIHDQIAHYFPELKPLIKWHLFDSTGPMHYIENTLFHLGYRGEPYDYRGNPHPTNIEYARITAVWPDMPESLLCHPDVRMLKVTRNEAAKPVIKLLEDRLPGLIAEFTEAMSAIVWDVQEARS